MDVGQSMYRQYRHAWLLVFIVCSGISVASASNPTNIPVTLEVYDSSKIEPVNVLEIPDSSTMTKSASSDNYEQDLERSLQEFDEKLLRELEQAQQERQESARQKAAVRSDAELEAEAETESDAGDDASGESAGDTEESSKTAGSDGQEGSSEEKLPEQTETTNSADLVESSSPIEEGTATAPKVTTPDGDDNDVIARQLREAAEAETDPKVKEKLWAEYRKYKNQQSPSAAPPAP